jgi:hypothetical protein
MPGQAIALTEQKLALRGTALEVNSAELPQMEVTRKKVDEVLVRIRDLTAQQASLTAAKQEVTKRLVELNLEAQKLITFVDAGIRAHYGSRSEKLVEFGQQPFRSQPRLKLVGPDGKPVKPGAAPTEPTAPPPTSPPATPPLKE